MLIRKDYLSTRSILGEDVAAFLDLGEGDANVFVDPWTFEMAVKRLINSELENKPPEDDLVS